MQENELDNIYITNSDTLQSMKAFEDKYGAAPADLNNSIDDISNLNKIWADPAFRAFALGFWERVGCTTPRPWMPYFCNRLSALGPEFVPTIDDYLHLRIRTTGIVENRFNVCNHTFTCFHVGGQRSERKKWVHVFDNTDAVLYVSRLTHFRFNLFEDEKTNRLSEDIQLFHDIAGRFLPTRPVIIIFTFADMFEQDILSNKVSEADLRVLIPVCQSLEHYWSDCCTLRL